MRSQYTKHLQIFCCLGCIVCTLVKISVFCSSVRAADPYNNSLVAIGTFSCTFFFHLLLQSSLWIVYYFVMFVQFFMSVLYVMMFSYCRRFVRRGIYISCILNYIENSWGRVPFAYTWDSPHNDNMRWKPFDFKRHLIKVIKDKRRAH
jgi:hypothetical protein